MSDYISEHAHALLALSTIPNLGAATIKNLLSEFPDPIALVHSGSEIGSKVKLPKRFQKGFRTLADWSYADQKIRETQDASLDIITFLDPVYPSRLKEITNPPPILWSKGNRDLLQKVSIAVIGTRFPSLYGKKMTRLFSEGLAQMGFVIVSGLAEGVDAGAHKIAMETTGETIAVLGSGLNWIYPKKNRSLAKEIIQEGGLILSEFPPGTPPSKEHFPIRNRTVSGLSMGVLVIESAKKGGSMITAARAREQNREVFAIPHPLQVESGSGCNQLIRMQTAKLVQSFEDITEELPVDISPKEVPILQYEESTHHHLLPIQQEILQLLGEKELHLQVLAEMVNMALPRLYSYLMDLEVKGLIRQAKGQMISRIE